MASGARGMPGGQGGGLRGWLTLGRRFGHCGAGGCDTGRADRR